MTEVRNFTVLGKMSFLDFLADLEENIESSWVFVNQNLIENLCKSDNYLITWSYDLESLYVENTARDEKAILKKFISDGWYVIQSLHSNRIKITEISSVCDPRYVIKLNGCV